MDNTKPNDWFLNITANSDFTISDFRDVGLDGNNTSLEDENTYKDSQVIQENPMFQTDGKFDETKFHKMYNIAAETYNVLADETYQEDVLKRATFHRDDIFADPSQRREGPDFVVVREPNPLKQKKGIRRISLSDSPELSDREIAQTQDVWDPKSKSWQASPNESFFKNFWETRVIAQWDEDGEHVDPMTGETVKHSEGERKFNKDGSVYYENLNGRDIYGRQVLSKMDVLTVDGSFWNKYDFFDSDDLDKSIGGTFAKNVAEIAPMFIPGIGPWYVGIGIAKELTKALSVAGKIFAGSNSPTLSAIEGFASSLDGSSSDYASNHPWAIENIINLTGDVAKQLYEQRWLFKYAPAAFGGGVMNESKQAKLVKDWAETYTTTKIAKIGDLAKSGKSLDVLNKELNIVGTLNAQARLKSVMENYNNVGKLISRAYMTGITVQDAYGKAKQEGASDTEAALLTLGYAAGEYAIISSSLGEWILPELRMEKESWKQVARVLTHATEKSMKGASKEQKSQFLKKLFDTGKDIASANYAVKTGLKATAANALGEGIEEVSEEVLYDFAKSLSNVGSWLAGSDTRLIAWDDMASRYGLSFVGGSIGGGIFQEIPMLGEMNIQKAKQLKKLEYNQAYQQMVYMARNGQMEKFIKTANGMTLGDKNLSASKYTVEDGKVIWAQGTKTDNQDLAAKQTLANQAKIIEDILNSNGALVSDDGFLDIQTLGDLKYAALTNSAVTGSYLQDYNTLMTQIVEKTQQISSADTRTDEDRRKGVNEEAVSSAVGKLNAELKSLLDTKDEYLTGVRAPEFIERALFEMSPVMNEPFFASTFLRYAETKESKNIGDIAPARLEELKEEYKGYSETKRKDDAFTAWRIFKTINEKTSPLFEAHSMRYYESLDENFAATIKFINDSILSTSKVINSTSNSEFSSELADDLHAGALSLGSQLISQLGTGSENSDFMELVNRPITEDYSQISKNIDINAAVTKFVKSRIEGIVKPILAQGYINPIVKQQVSKLIGTSTYYAYSIGDDYMGDELTNMKKDLDNLSDSPILEVLNSFSLSTTDSGLNISKLYTDLDKQLVTKAEDVSTFGITKDTNAQIKEALTVIGAARSVIFAARNDNADLGNVFGYNATINSLNPEVKVVELQSEVADSMTKDLELIEQRFLMFQRLNAINNEQKLNEQNRTAVNKDYIIYKKVGNFIVAIPDDWEGKAELNTTYKSLVKYKGLYESKRLSLSIEEKTDLERERIMLEDAIYTFFNSNMSRLKDPKKLSRLINTTNFSLYSFNEEILDSESTDIDDNSFVYYLAARAALKSSDFYGEYKQIINDRIAPIPTQEMAVYLGYANALNGQVVSAFAQAVNESLLEDSVNLTLDERKKISSRVSVNWKYILDSRVAPRFSNIAFFEGIPGSGKTTGVYNGVITLLRKFHPSLLKDVWIGHATKESAKKLSNSLHLDKAVISDKTNLMKMVSQEWSESLNPDGSVDISKDATSMDDKNITHSKLDINEVSNPPSLILIDEVSKYSVLDMDLINRFAARYGIVVLVAGDFDQTKITGKYEVEKGLTNYMTLDRNSFIRSPKLGVSMRTNNSQKSFNLKYVRASLPDLVKGNTEKLHLHYYMDETGLYGDYKYYVGGMSKFNANDFRVHLERMINTLSPGEKIGYIYYSTETPVYKLLSESTYKDKIDWHEGNSAQGLEGQYYIIEMNPKSSLSAEQYYGDLYTGLTRAAQGSIIMDYGSDERLFNIEMTEDSSTNLEELSEDSIKKYSTDRVGILNTVVTTSTATMITPRESDSSITTVKPTTIIIEEEKEKEEAGTTLKSEVIEVTNEDTGKPEKIIVTNSGLEPTKVMTSKTLEASVNPLPLPEAKIEVATSGEESLSTLLYSFNTFETGTGDSNYTIDPNSPRIDGFNGLEKLPHFSQLSVDDKKTIIADLRSLIMHTKDKGNLEEAIANYLGLNKAYVSFAFKSSPGSDPKYGKFSKDRNNEKTEYVYATDTRSNQANPKSLVVIIGEDTPEGKRDVLELPILTLSSPRTMLSSRSFQEVKKVDDKIDKGLTGHFRDVALLQALEATPDFSGKKSFTNLMKVWMFTQKGIFFIDDPKWTIASNLKSQGPAIINKSKGHTYEQEGFSFDGKWVSLGEYSMNPNVVVSKVLLSTDGKYTYNNGNKTVDFVKPGQPFVLISYDRSLTGGELKQQYYKQLVDPNEEAKVKLVYVVAPRADVGEYFESIKNLITKEGNPKNIGNDFTPYRILSLVMAQPNAIEFIDSSYHSSMEAITKILSDIGTAEGTKAKYDVLKETVDVPGISSNLTKQQALQNFLMRMVYPVRFGGGYVFKDGILDRITNILSDNGIDGIFYNVKFDKNSKDPIMVEAVTNDDYTIDGHSFDINGKIDSPAFYGNISPLLETIVDKIKTKGNATFSTDNNRYESGQPEGKLESLPVLEQHLSRKNVFVPASVLSSMDAWIKANTNATPEQFESELLSRGYIPLHVGDSVYVSQNSTSITDTMTSIPVGTQITLNTWKFDLPLGTFEFNVNTREGILTTVNTNPSGEAETLENVIKAENEADVALYKIALQIPKSPNGKAITGHKSYKNILIASNVEEFNMALGEWSGLNNKVLEAFRLSIGEVDTSMPNGNKTKTALENIVKFIEHKLNIKQDEKSRDTTCTPPIIIKF